MTINVDAIGAREVKRKFVVAYDYGQGAAWGVILAESSDQIRSRFRDLEVFDDVPLHIDEETASGIRAEPAIDIDDPPPPWLAKLAIA
jgi:hypothetical protein